MILSCCSRNMHSTMPWPLDLTISMRFLCLCLLIPMPIWARLIISLSFSLNDHQAIPMPLGMSWECVFVLWLKCVNLPLWLLVHRHRVYRTFMILQIPSHSKGKYWRLWTIHLWWFSIFTALNIQFELR